MRRITLYPAFRGHRRPRRGFSLVELVIVVTIIGVLASIAMSRMVNVSGKTKAAALEAALASVRKAIDIYYAEHGKYPGYNHSTGAPDNSAFVDQLLMYTDADGKTNAAYTSTYMYGPYLRSPFPQNPTNELATVQVKATPGDADPAKGSVGWVAVLSHGYFGVSATDGDLGDIGINDPVQLTKLRGGYSAEE